MLFVVAKPKFEGAIRLARGDHKKRLQGNRGPYIRLEANDDYVEVAGLEAVACVPATVYEPGVLYLKVTLFRRLLHSIRAEPFLTIQATADDLVFGMVRMPLEANAMLLYSNPKFAPRYHPEQGPLIHPVLIERPPAVTVKVEKPKRIVIFRQRSLWNDADQDAEASLQ